MCRDVMNLESVRASIVVSQTVSIAGDMGETLHLLFRTREDATFELQVRESWSGGDRHYTGPIAEEGFLEADTQEVHHLDDRLAGFGSG
jgi:hypothetical protein